MSGERNPAIQREDDGKLLEKYVTITIPGKTATVQSQSNDKIYHLNIEEQTCECADFKYRGTYCKHLQAVDSHLLKLTKKDLLLEIVN